MKIAVIDLGTNTCNLLIADAIDHHYEIIHQSKELVRLGDSKIKSNQISHEAIERVLTSLHNHSRIISQYKPERIRIIATSAIRTAENKVNLLELIGQETGWVTRVISGEKEAELIFKGVLLAFDTLPGKPVILDIGGGSNEMIIASGKQIICQGSFPTGMARVINRFDLSDPVTKADVDALLHFYSEEHGSFYKRCRMESVDTLIGCSGAFDTIADIIDEVDPGQKQRKIQEISPDQFWDVYNRLISSTHQQRLDMKGMDMVRVDLIVPAVVLIGQLIRETNIKSIIQTDYALREGVLYEEMKKQAAGNNQI